MSSQHKFRRSTRFRTVTEEAMRVAPDVAGAELASFRRRLVAFAFDLLLIVLFSIPTLFGVAYFSTKLAAPRAIELLHEIRTTEDEEAREPLWREFINETMYLIYKRMPERLPGEFIEAFETVDSTTVIATEIDTVSGDTTFTYATYIDSATVDSLAATWEWNFQVAFSDKPITRFDERTRTVHAGMYIYMGHISIIANFGAVLIVYFTFCIWLLHGFTPGKWIFRIRVIRIDNKRLNLWDAFGRAGGYSASVATLGLGFLEALWHPNRQAVHDRISETVVLRVRKKPRTDNQD